MPRKSGYTEAKRWAKIDDTFSDEQVLVAWQDFIPWFIDFVNYLLSDVVLKDLPLQQRQKFMYDIRKYF